MQKNVPTFFVYFLLLCVCNYCIHFNEITKRDLVRVCQRHICLCMFYECLQARENFLSELDGISKSSDCVGS